MHAPQGDMLLGVVIDSSSQDARHESPRQGAKEHYGEPSQSYCIQNGLFAPSTGHFFSSPTLSPRLQVALILMFFFLFNLLCLYCGFCRCEPMNPQE